MTEVYLPQYGNYVAYEGGDVTVLSVCSTYQLALEVIKTFCKQRGIELPAEQNARNEWDITRDRGTSEWLEIATWTVDSKLQWVGGAVVDQQGNRFTVRTITHAGENAVYYDLEWHELVGQKYEKRLLSMVPAVNYEILY